MANVRTTAMIAAGLALSVAVPAHAETQAAPRPVVQTATAPAATGEVRDIVQTAFFQALTAPAPSSGATASH